MPTFGKLLPCINRINSKEVSKIVRELAKFLGLAMSILVVAFLCFRLFHPYAFSGFIAFDERFLSDIDYLRSVNSGADVPWVIQWVGITPLWFPFKSIFWHGMGPGLAVAVLVGLWLTVSEVIRKRNHMLIIPLSFAIVMLGLVSQQFNPLIRYLLPVYPIAITFGGFGIYRLWHWGKEKKIIAEKKIALYRLSQGASAILTFEVFIGQSVVLLLS